MRTLSLPGGLWIALALGLASCNPTAHFAIDAGGAALFTEAGTPFPEATSGGELRPDLATSCAPVGSSCNATTGPFCCVPSACGPFGTCAPPPPDAGIMCIGFPCKTSADCCRGTTCLCGSCF